MFDRRMRVIIRHCNLNTRKMARPLWLEILFHSWYSKAKVSLCPRCPLTTLSRENLCTRRHNKVTSLSCTCHPYALLSAYFLPFFSYKRMRLTTQFYGRQLHETFVATMTLANDSLYAVNEAWNNRSEPHTGQVVVIIIIISRSKILNSMNVKQLCIHWTLCIMYIGYYTHSTCAL